LTAQKGGSKFSPLEELLSVYLGKLEPGAVTATMLPPD
jgi:hypothetical protein